jgi:hypothetical protein
MDLYVDAIIAALNLAGLDAVLRERDTGAWEQAWAALLYQGVSYDAAMIDYQHAYFRGAGWEIKDASLVLLTNGRPCGLWPLTLGGPAEQPQLTSSGGAVMAPVFVHGLSARVTSLAYPPPAAANGINSYSPLGQVPR